MRTAWSPGPVPASRSSCQTTRIGHHGTLTEPCCIAREVRRLAPPYLGRGVGQALELHPVPDLLVHDLGYVSAGLCATAARHMRDEQRPGWAMQRHSRTDARSTEGGRRW